MKVLVTGAAGRLGRVVARVLHDRGHDVVATDLLYPGKREFPFVVADLLRADAVYPLLEGCDALVHLGNHPNVKSAPAQRLYSENCTMNGNVFQAASEVGTPRIFFASTIQVVSGDGAWGIEDSSVPAYLPLDGALPPTPRNVYSLSKLAGEHMLQALVARGTPTTGISIRWPSLLTGQKPPRKSPWLPGPHESLPISSVCYLFFSDGGTLVDSLLRSSATGYHTIMPTAEGTYLELSPTEIRSRFYPRTPLRISEDCFERFVDVTHVTHLAPDWSPVGVLRSAEDVGDRQ